MHEASNAIHLLDYIKKRESFTKRSRALPREGRYIFKKDDMRKILLLVIALNTLTILMNIFTENYTLIPFSVVIVMCLVLVMLVEEKNNHSVRQLDKEMRISRLERDLWAWIQVEVLTEDQRKQIEPKLDTALKSIFSIIQE